MNVTEARAAELLPIGAVADGSATTVKTVRYYDDIGLIEAAIRVGGKRRFDPETVNRVTFIRRAQDTGFSLDEIRMILDDASGGWNQLVAGKLDELRDRRTHLDRMIALLEEMRGCGCNDALACVQGAEWVGPKIG